MARRLFVVKETFILRSLGLILTPGIIPEGDERFRIGDQIVLRRPDGSSLEWQIGGLEFLDPNPNRDVVILLKELAQEDVPIGTEVWSADD